MKKLLTNKKDKPKTMSSVPLTFSQLQSRQNQLLVVDVRGWFEYFIGHIAGAKNQSRSYSKRDS